MNIFFKTNEQGEIIKVLCGSHAVVSEGEYNFMTTVENYIDPVELMNRKVINNKLVPIFLGIETVYTL